MLSREQAEALAHLVHLLRPEWDRAGIFTALGRCKDRNELDVAMAAIRAAGSSEIRSPGAIPIKGEHWHERVSVPVAPRPPKPHEACHVCGRHFDACLCEDGPTVRAVMPVPDAAPRVARLREIARDATADHCSHGVDRRNCLDHRATKTAPPTEGASE